MCPSTEQEALLVSLLLRDHYKQTHKHCPTNIKDGVHAREQSKKGVRVEGMWGWEGGL